MPWCIGNLRLVFDVVFGYAGCVSGYLGSHVEPVLRADLDGLTVSQLQAHALELRVVGERLLGRADQIPAVLQKRSGGQVLERSQQRPSPGPVQDVVQGTADGDDSGAVQPEAFAAPAMPLLMSVQTWWREATRVAGTQAGRDVSRAGVSMRFPVWGQAVTDGILTPAQAEVLCRLVGKLPDTELLATQTELVTVAAALNPVELGQWVRHLIATWCEPELDREQDRAEAEAWLQLDKRPDRAPRGTVRDQQRGQRGPDDGPGTPRPSAGPRGCPQRRSASGGGSGGGLHRRRPVAGAAQLRRPAGARQLRRALRVGPRRTAPRPGICQVK